MSDEVLVKAEGVSKKFCRSLKRSLWYGVQDVACEVLGREGHHDELRKNEFWAVHDVSFELKRGECLGLIGPNGAGKSTLLKLLNGLIKPDKGRITMRGRVGALIELGAGFNPVLTARENIYVNGSVLGFGKKEIDKKFDAIVEFSEIEEFLDMPVQNFSSGMKVRLGFAIAVQVEPDVMLIDEVLAVGDLQFRMACYQRMLQLKESGTAIILISHAMIDISRICSRAAVANRGRLIEYDRVSEAIHEYQSITSARSEETPGAKSKRFSLKHVHILNDEGLIVADFNTNDDIIMEIQIHAESVLTGARLLVNVDSAAGPVSSVGSPYSNFSLTLKPPGNTIRFCLKRNPFLLGVYQVSVGLYGPSKTDALDQLVHAASFRIVAPETDPFGYSFYHLIRLDHEWTELN